VAALGSSLDQKFDPARFLSEFSARAQTLIPHDYILIQRRDDDGQTCSAFAEHAVRGALLGDGSPYTLALERGDRVPAEAFALGPIFEGHAQVVADITTDPRFGDDAALRAKMVEAGLRARLAVPLSARGRITGALVVMSGTAGRYTEAHVSSGRLLADLIGPFVESVGLLHRERRHRERLKAVMALPPILGDSLKVGDVVKRLGDALRPVIDFELMVLRGLAPTGQGYELLGTVSSHPVHAGPVTSRNTRSGNGSGVGRRSSSATPSVSSIPDAPATGASSRAATDHCSAYRSASVGAWAAC
jgi:hypothetical protein